MAHGIGERVRLNSGGPEMVVVDVVGTSVVVTWPDRNGEMQKSMYPDQCVQFVPVAEITPRLKYPGIWKRV